MKMNKLFAVSALNIISLCSIASAQDAFTVKGTISDWPTEYIHLIRRGDFPGEDSVKLVNGSFEFNGSIGGPTNAFLVAKQPTGAVAKFIYVEPSNIEVKGSFKDFENVKVVGSKTHNEYEEVRLFNVDFQNKLKAIQKEQSARVMKIEESKVFDERIDSLYETKYAFSKNFIKTHPNSVVSIPELFTLFGSEKIETIQALFDGLSPEIKATPGGDLVDYNLKQNTSKTKIDIGSIAPDFTQPDVDGKPVKLSDYRGKYVLVDFWASWCAPCRAENPNLVLAYEQFKSKGFDILGVSIDEAKAADLWKKAIKVDRLTWTQVADLKGSDNEAAILYGVTSIPTNYLIDQEGKVVAKNLRGAELINTLKEIIK